MRLLRYGGKKKDREIGIVFASVSAKRNARRVLRLPSYFRKRKSRRRRSNDSRACEARRGYFPCLAYFLFSGDKTETPIDFRVTIGESRRFSNGSLRAR